MEDTAHEKTDALLLQLNHDITILYRKVRRKIKRDLLPQVGDLYLDKDDATQRERLKYAEKVGKKDKAIESLVNTLVDAGARSAELINQNQAETYKINFQYACNDVIKQITDSMKED